MNRVHRSRKRASQSGVSLIELLIGIVIGLLVCLAALMTLAGARSTSVTVEDSVSLHQDAALAWRVIGQALQEAGARSLLRAPAGNAAATDIDVMYRADYTGLGTTAQPVDLNGTNGAGTAPDTLRVSQDSDGARGTADCFGETQTNTVIANSFVVVRGELRCDVGSNRRGLVTGVEDFQVTYAERTGNATRYVHTPAVWHNVMAVRICLQLAGDATGQPTAAIQGCQGNVAADGRIRQAFWRVFTLRNANP